MRYFDDIYFSDFKQSLQESGIDLPELVSTLSGVEQDVDSFEYLTDASAVYSSNIEGNTMDVNSFMNSKLGGAQSKQKEYTEIVDLIDAYDFAKENILTEESLKYAHKILSRQLVSKGNQGEYRKDRVGVYDAGGLVYMAVEPEHVQEQMYALFVRMSELLVQKDSLNTEEVFYFASMLHLHIAHIHPFADGNGRIARLVEKWFLASVLGEQVWGIQSEKFYKEHLKEYYTHINLGVNFYELDYTRSISFLTLLPKSPKMLN